MADSNFAQILITAKDATKAGFDSAKTNAREFQATLSRLEGARRAVLGRLVCVVACHSGGSFQVCREPPGGGA